jgi:hypothetical protein
VSGEAGGGAGGGGAAARARGRGGGGCRSPARWGGGSAVCSLHQSLLGLGLGLAGALLA